MCKSGDNIHIALGQMTHTLTAYLPVAHMKLKSILKDLMSTKVAKKNYKKSSKD